MSKKRYILITGNGRSGTNWVLDILNMSPLTHCRNEPHRISSSPFHCTTKVWKAGNDLPEMAQIWDSAADWTATTLGERDPRTVTVKKHIYPHSQALGLINLPLKPKTRKLISFFMPSLKQAEWSMPWWVGSTQALQEAVGVFKIINTDARNIIWLLENRPDFPKIHVIRHPAGRLNSWLNRFLSEQDETSILKRNQSRLETIRVFDENWAQQLGDIDAMGIVETEVWLWRYYNEVLYEAGQQHPQYLCVLYEEIVKSPLNYAAKIYDFCNLPWDDDLEKSVEQRLGQSVWGKLSGSSQSVADSWKNKLDTESIEIVDQVLAGSFMKKWWTA